MLLSVLQLKVHKGEAMMFQVGFSMLVLELRLELTECMFGRMMVGVENSVVCMYIHALTLTTLFSYFS